MSKKLLHHVLTTGGGQLTLILADIGAHGVASARGGDGGRKNKSGK